MSSDEKSKPKDEQYTKLIKPINELKETIRTLNKQISISQLPEGFISKLRHTEETCCKET